MNKFSEAEYMAKHGEDISKDIESSKESKNDLEKFWNRKVEFAGDITKMQLGEISKEHPAYEYLNSIITKLSPSTDIEIRIIPDKYGANAFALPDGTIGITSSFFAFAEYEEVIAAALAHELIHIEREHAKGNHIIQTSGVDMTSFRILGQKRKYEYEADIRAAFEKMEKAGINPLGMKILLEKLAEHENKFGGYGDVHGRSSDRALNIATGTYLMDLKSLSSNLHTIPEDFVSSFDSVETHEGKDLFNRPKDSAGKIKSHEDRRSDRRKYIESLQYPEEIFIAIRTIADYRESDDPDDDMCLRALFEKAKKIITNKVGVSEVGSNILIAYFAGVKLSTIDQFIPRSSGTPLSTSKLISELDTISHLPNLFAYSLSSGSSFAYSLIGWMKDNRLLNNKNDIHFAEKLDGVVTSFNASYGRDSSSEKTCSQAFNELFDIKSSSVEKEALETKQKSHLEEPSWEKVESDLDPVLIELFKINVKKETISGFDEALPAITASVKERLRNKSTDELIIDLKKIYKAIYSFSRKKAEYYYDLKGARSVQYEYWSRFPLIVSDSYIITIFNECINDEVLFPNITLVDKERVKCLIGFLIQPKAKSYVFSSWRHSDTRLEMSHRDVEEGGSYDPDKVFFGEDLDDVLKDFDRERKMDESRVYRGKNDLHNSDFFELSPEDNRVFSKYRKLVNSYSVEGKYLLNKVTSESIADTYHFFNDRKDDEIAGLLSHDLSAMIIESKSFEENLGILLSQMFDRAIHKKGLKFCLKFIDDCNKNIPDFEGMLIHNKDLLLNFTEKIAEAFVDESIFSLSINDIFRLTSYIKSVFIRDTILQTALGKKWGSTSFEEKMDFLFPKGGGRSVIDFELRERFMCQDVNTQKDFNIVKERVEKSIDDVLRSSSASQGVFVLFDRLSFKYHDPVALIEAALSTETDDEALIYWIESNIRLSASAEISRITEDDEEYEYEIDENKISPRQGAYKFADQLYALDPLSKRVFLRRILMGEGGLLLTQESRKKFFDKIFSKWIEDDSSQHDLKDVIDRVKQALIEEDSPEILYFALQGVLADKLFIVPERLRKVSFDEHSEFKANPEEKMLRKIVTSPGRIKKQKLHPVAFVKEVAGNLGALGRRFLQVLPQFVVLPEKYEEEFSDVYDKVAGQSKFAALVTVEREWPELWKELPYIGDRIGGGSIVTVFEARNKDGREEVLKVRNPNILYHLDESEKVSLSISNRLSEVHKGSYSQAKNIIPDISQWVKNDVEFEGFLDKDLEFRTKYEGYSAEGNKYSVKIPESFGPPSAYFAREEKISGMNLTALDQIIKSPGHNAKQVVSLLTKFYVQQIVDGRLHSDVHPGNYSVTDSYELVVYDRNYYIDFTDSEKQIILELFNPIGDGKSKVDKLMELFQAPDESRIHVESFVDSLSKGDIDEAKKKIINIKSSGTKIPLNFTLLLKNLGALNGMARKVGFSNFVEAVFS